MRSSLLYFIILFSLITSVITNAQECEANWLSTDGNKIVDINGDQVILAGVNWFGFENGSRIPNGIWQRDTESMLQQVQDLGFNCLRIPWSNDNLFTNEGLSEEDSFIFKGEDPYTGVSPSNPNFTQGVTTPMDVMDFIVNWCQDNDMKIILDNHSRIRDNFKNEFVWYTENFSHEQWIEDWRFLANRYKDFSAVAGMDLNNEPHGNAAGGGLYAQWGSGDPSNDWMLAAEECGNAILEVNPNVLIVVEGVTEYVRPSDGFGTNYWDGGNLQGVRDHKVKLSDETKLVYSPHEYGPHLFASNNLEGGVTQPWFEEENFAPNLPALWEEYYNFLNSSDTAPLLLGEFGIKAQLVKSEQWFSTMVDYIEEQGLHFTYWCVNPDSGDTGGILEGDWVSVEQWKMDYLKPLLHDPIPNCIEFTGVAESPVVVVPDPVIDEPEPIDVVVPDPVIDEPEPVDQVVPDPVIDEPEPVDEVVPDPVIDEPDPVDVVVPDPVIDEPDPVDVVTPDPEDPIVSELEDVDELDEGHLNDVEFEIYPNPTNNLINFTSNVQEFNLYDLRGRTISNIETIIEGSRYDLSTMSSGIYLAQITTENGLVITMKIVKQ